MSDEDQNENENKIAPTLEEVGEPTGSVGSEPVLETQPESVPIPNPSEPISEPTLEIPQQNELKTEVASEPNGGIGSQVASEPVVVPEMVPIQVETTPPPSPSELLPQSKSFISNLLAKANYALRFRKMKKVEKILELAKWNATISNDDIQKMLRVSHRTASRYLTELVKQNKLVRLGHPKHAKYKLP